METQEILQGIHDWTNRKIVYDISVAHPDGQGNPTPYANLAAALGTNGANIPQNLRKGGMSVKFVHSYDNKYVQYRLMSDTFNTTPANWQGVDDEPTTNSENLIKSGGVKNAVNAVNTKVGYYICNSLQASYQKEVNVQGYVLEGGGCIKIKMTFANILDTPNTLNINNTGEKPLYYEGLRANKYNSWQAGEVLDVYYDPTHNSNEGAYMAYNADVSVDEGVFNISKYRRSGDTFATFASLTDAIGTNGANVPVYMRRNGVTIKYIDVNNGEYVQCRYLSSSVDNSEVTKISNWQSLDDSPKALSRNLVESYGIKKGYVSYNQLCFLKSFVDPFYVYCEDTIAGNINGNFTINFYYIHDSLTGVLISKEDVFSIEKTTNGYRITVGSVSTEIVIKNFTCLFTITRNGDTLYVYMNGKERYSATLSGTVESQEPIKITGTTKGYQIVFETAEEYTDLAKHTELLRRYTSGIFECVYKNATSRFSPLSIKKELNSDFIKIDSSKKTRIQFAGEVSDADWIATTNANNPRYDLVLSQVKVLSKNSSIWSDINETGYLTDRGRFIASNNPIYVTDFIDVSNNTHVDIIGKATLSPAFKILFYGKDKTTIVQVVDGNDSNYINYLIPTNAYYMKATLNLANSDIWLRGNRDKDREDISATDAIVANLGTTVNSLAENTDIQISALQNQLDSIKQEAQNDRINIVMVDSLQTIKYPTSTLNTIGPFNIVSSTANSIVLSAEDFANIYDYDVQGLCVEIPVSGSDYPRYRTAIFKKSDNNTLIQYSTDVDLTNATRCSSIHDTLYAGNGIHLSPFGYRALACTVVERLTMKDCYNNKNYIGGFVSMNCKTGQYNTENIEAPDGTILVRPIRVNAKKGGFMPGTNITPLWGFIDLETINNTGFSNLMKQFVFMQYKEETDDEVSIELPFTFGRTNGYLVIEGNCDGQYPGRAKIEVIENGVTVWETIMSDIAQKYIIGLRTWSNFSVKVSLPENNKVTRAKISAVCLYEMYDGFEYPNLSGKTIAVLGDSWCVYNDMTTSKHFLGENNEDCENFGQYPDGTPTEYSAYCALFPKYLAHITGSTVDDWGRGGTTSENWGLVKIDHILDFKSYDYLVIEFFTNDKILGMNVDTWRRNLQEICRKCIKKGVQPIVIMPCVNQGTGFGFAEWNNYLLQGLYFGLD